MNEPPARHRVAWQLAALLLGTLLTAGFWWPLLLGAGFVGGDLYNYFFPLRSWYAEGLASGELRFWHTKIGLGASVLGESQTGMFYPPYLLAYRLLPLTSAYSAVFLGHYVLAFAATFGLARKARLSAWASLLAAIVFVFGWFPPRSCLEWAIVTGAWFPVLAYLALGWLQEGRPRHGVLLALAQGVQLLAGHYQLAFVSVLGVTIMSLCWPGRDSEKSDADVLAAPGPTLGRRLAVPLLLGVGFLLAGPQLLPTWEYKQGSDRDTAGFVESLQYGNIPPDYLLQLVAPWVVYPQADQWLATTSNKIEAHFYLGLVPLAILVVGGLTLAVRRRVRGGDAERPSHDAGPSLRPWLVLLIVGLVLAIGWPMPWLAELPGFGFFRYPGRYGLMAQLGAALAIGVLLDRLLGSRLRPWVVPAVLVLTAADLFLVGRMVQNVAMVPHPPIERVDQSVVFGQLGPTDRVLAPDPNSTALGPAACLPTYLGMSPTLYREFEASLPANFFRASPPVDDALVVRLRRWGVTHLLTEEPLGPGWPVTREWQGVDPFLHARWGRDPTKPFHLYRLNDSPGRVRLERADGSRAAGEVRLVRYEPQAVEIAVRAEEPCRVVLADLASPGWHAHVDGSPVAAGGDEARRPERTVDVPAGRHHVLWRYRPASFVRGVVLAFLGLAALLAWCWAPNRVSPNRRAP